MVTNRKIYKVLNNANIMEKKNESNDQDRINAILFGNDVKEEYNEDAVIFDYQFNLTDKMNATYNNHNPNGGSN